MRVNFKYILNREFVTGIMPVFFKPEERKVRND